jgi:2-phosphoglycolate phosphatase
VFDLDGTLVDSYGPIAESVNHVRDAFGLPRLAEDDIRRRVGRGLEALMAEVVGAGHVEAGVRMFRERYAQVYAPRTQALPGADATLRALSRRGFAMSVASNKPSYFGKPILDQLGLLQYLLTVEGPDTAGKPKPDPAMIHLCLQAMRATRQEAVYVGDMVLDVETAARAGISVILVPGGSSSPPELRHTGETVLDSLAELPEILPGPDDADRLARGAANGASSR